MKGGWLRVWGCLTDWCTLEARRSYGVGLWKIIGIRCGPQKKKNCLGIRCLRALGMVAGCISGMMCGMMSLLF